MELFKYRNKLIRATDKRGGVHSGVAEVFPAEYGLRMFGREEESLALGGTVLFADELETVEYLPDYNEAVTSIPPGRYRHFKGRDYEVLALARHSETEEPMVVYRTLYGDGGVWVRPASMWNETVARDGKLYRRFYRLDRIERIESYERLFDEATADGDEGKLRQLEVYYSSGQWLEDYEADERGELPPDLKRGVLSQDALYELLEKGKE